MKILLTGASGQLGHVLAPRLARRSDVTDLLAPLRAELDLTDEQGLRDYLRATRPDVIINAAAYTAVDKAEEQTGMAHAINAIAPSIMAEEAQRLGAPLVHFSTDYVFDGSGSCPFTEDDATGPLNVYGHSKLAGEQAVASLCDTHWILRTSWVYGAHGGNFLRTIMRLAREREQINVVEDQIGAPTWTHTIADAVERMIDCRSAHTTLAQHVRHTRGLYHLSARGATSWHRYAQTVVSLLRQHGVPGSLVPGQVLPIPSSGYPTPARRPMNSRLDVSKLERTFSLALPAWEDALARCVAEMLASDASAAQQQNQERT